jgi:RNA polymerase sigma-70 factor (ECF subfamily)
MAKNDFDALERAIGERLDAGKLSEAATLAIRGFGPQILGYLGSVVRDDGLADEAFSRFAEDLWKGIAGFRRESSMRTWAYRVAWNAARDLQTEAFRRRGRRLETAEISKVVQEVQSSSASFLKQDARDKLDKLRRALSPEEQTLLILRVDRKLSWKECAQVLATQDAPVDEAALRKRFERITKRLKKMAQEQGVLQKTPEDG